MKLYVINYFCKVIDPKSAMQGIIILAIISTEKHT